MKTCFAVWPNFSNFGMDFAGKLIPPFPANCFVYLISPLHIIVIQYFNMTENTPIRVIDNSNIFQLRMSGSAPHIGVEQVSIDIGELDKSVPDYDCLPLLVTRNLVLFPGVHQSVQLTREMSVAVAEYAESTHNPIGLVCQRDPSVEVPQLEDLFDYGVVVDVLKVIELPDGEKTALLRARDKFRIQGCPSSNAVHPFLTVQACHVHETRPRKNDKEFIECVKEVRSLTNRIIENFYEEVGNPFQFDSKVDPVTVINVICTNMRLEADERFSLLACSRMRDRAFKLLEFLNIELERQKVKLEVMNKARANMEQNQRQVFLQQAYENIREELYGGDNDDADAFVQRSQELIWPDEVGTYFNKEIDKLRRLNPQSPDYSVQYSYLDTLLSLPWGKMSDLNNDFSSAEDELEKGHYGLEKVKERIIEQLAVMIDSPSRKSPILCLVGPPGVGKTSLGISIANALGRKYQRVALGGLHDEAEIRGHRRTYIGAMPGRIIDAMKRAGTQNPVLLLDEIDKIGSDFKGDPASALLEVLDPEQNKRFHDNYVDVDFDLSNVLFIATANTLQTVPSPLLDRIEVIEIPGYVTEEKIEIARRHLWPRLLAEQGWPESKLRITDEALAEIIEQYTSESGVRQLEKRLAAILRKSVLAAMRGKPYEKPIGVDDLSDLLGVPPFHRDRCGDAALSGVVTGLAWTQAGGEILLVETSLSPAKGGGKLTVTGNLGDVMKESATIALQWVKSNCKSIGIDPAMFENNNVHVHFPEGAIPKDGPSAGITMATAIVSAFTGKAVSPKLAMTGEITLRGKVLPVGGIREKLLAARRAGAERVLLCCDNRRDVSEIPERYLEGLKIEYVDTVADVLEKVFGM